MTPDEALAEILELGRRIERLEPGDPERQVLEQRRDALRVAAREASGRAMNRSYLETELEHLETRLRTLEGRKIRLPKWLSRMRWINDPNASLDAINRAIDRVDLDDREAIETRIAELREILGRE